MNRQEEERIRRLLLEPELELAISDRESDDGMDDSQEESDHDHRVVG